MLYLFIIGGLVVMLVIKYNLDILTDDSDSRDGLGGRNDSLGSE